MKMEKQHIRFITETQQTLFFSNAVSNDVRSETIMSSNTEILLYKPTVRTQKQCFMVAALSADLKFTGDLWTETSLRYVGPAHIVHCNYDETKATTQAIINRKMDKSR